MNTFEPIAIIGTGCVFPGCFDQKGLWEIIQHNKVQITDPEPEYWRVDMKNIVTSPEEKTAVNKAWNSKGGYIRDFDTHFNPSDFALDRQLVDELDPLFKWSFYAAYSALKNAGTNNQAILQKTGLIMGNLSYPTRSFSQYYEERILTELFPEWKNPDQQVDSINRFMSGLPAMLTAKALGLRGDSFAIDAACASSLYALKLGCDKLHNRTEDMMLIGGVCAVDQLFLHVGFTALNAMSPSGQSRPFNRGADGLIPSEGAGFIVIKRLQDAIENDDNILAVVRGIGLSNDGRSGGFLLPSQAGQVKSIKTALESGNIAAETVGYVECHATGTSTGDAIEIKSLKEVYGDTPLHLSSLKGNIGHTITSSGIASILKVIGSFANKTLPPTVNAYPLTDSLSDTNFVVRDKSVAWETAHSRRAGISNFGFGGNNAHVILEEWNPKTNYTHGSSSKTKAMVAIVGVEIQTECIADAKEYLGHLLGHTEIISGNDATISFDIRKLSSPPNDLKNTLSQQLLMLNTVQRLLDTGIKLEKENTGVFIGMGADAEINRYAFRKRLSELLHKGGMSAANSTELENKVAPILSAASVLGTMPNMPANRINNQYDFNGTGFTLSCEDLSGTKALKVAIDAIENGELNAAIVGAVDISNEFVHKEALSDVLNIKTPTSDSAIVLVLKNYKQALADGDSILATFGSEAKKDDYNLSEDYVVSKIGYSHAASSLLQLGTAALFAQNRICPNEAKNGFRPILESKHGFSYTVTVNSLFGGTDTFVLYSEPAVDISIRTTGQILLHCYAADSRQELIDAVTQNSKASHGSHKLCIISSAADALKLRNEAILALERADIKDGWVSRSTHYRSQSTQGDLAFVYTGAASAYPGMGKELLEEFPGLVSGLQPFCNEPSFAADWIYNNDTVKADLPFYQLAGSSFMCQIHSCFTTKILQLKPQTAIGLSSGETNSVIALGLWDDMDSLLKEINDSDLYDVALGGDFESVRKYWGLAEDEHVAWENWRMLAPVNEVKKLVAAEDRVYLTIINTDRDCVIGGDSAACARIIDVLGSLKAMPLRHDIVVHCSPVEPFEREWRKLHTRKANKVPGIRFYSNHLDGIYDPNSESIADALTGQALHTIDFPKIIEKAWNDGVRIFVEHGPRNSLSTSIAQILKGKDFVGVAMDSFGRSGVSEALKVAAELWCCGVQVNLGALIAQNDLPKTRPSQEIKFPMHMPNLFEYTPLQKKEVINDNERKQENGMISPFTAAPKLAVTKRTKQAQRNKEMPVVATNVPTAAIPKEHKAEFIAQHTGEEDHIIDLFKKQHNALVEAHQHFLDTQLSAQAQFNAIMHNRMLQLMGETTNEIFYPEQKENAIAEQVVSNEYFTPLIPETRPMIETAPRPTQQIAPIEETIVVKKENELPGPQISRDDLITLSSGKISSILGPLFAKQDHYAIQVRMPEPPLLLCDRVMGIKGEPGSLGLGTIWTETDVKSDSWYLHNNRMPPGIFIEAGQADLLLISWLGIDFQNKGERAYRLLGCELTFYGELPKPGETLKYDIHVDGYAKSGDTTLFFFHYDCHIDGKLRISVRNGQAGFFTVQELEESKGVIWDPASAKYSAVHSVILEECHTHKTSFSKEDIEKYTLGNMVGCFGEELSWTQTHTRSPRSQGGYQNFIKNITHFDLNGGPAGRGYLRSETIVHPDDWYFKGHFKNDPCMPGTLMADACLQMMAFYMVGAGLSVNKDGWRFEPVTDEKYKFVCRGQVTPASQKVTYEIFVDQIVDGTYPTLYAHVLTTVDGNKAFLCERLGLRLVPDYPLQTMQHLIAEDVPGKQIATYKGFKFRHRSLMNCALGNPEDAFGPDFIKYAGGSRSPRLPGPPYHFMTRIADFNVVPGQYKNNPFVTAEYDIPHDAWYLANPGSVMPYAVLMEVALQPCGWLSTFVCQPEIVGKDLVFRNLDGKAVQHRAITSSDRTVRTKTTLTSVSVMGEVIIVKFDVVSTVDEKPVFTMNTVFGFFDTGSMRSQKGLPISAEEQKNIELDPNREIDLTVFPDKYFGNKTACLPASKILMIDRIRSYYPKGGKYGKGYMKAEKTVVKDDWFFKAHFFQDPVQPGSLGIEAMLQLMQFYMIDQGYGEQSSKPYFEPVLLEDETEWHYRGQVTPDKKLISIDFDVKDINVNDGKIVLIAEARLWVDGLKIYHAPNIGMRMFEG